MSRPLAFLKRDLLVESSYPVSFTLTIMAGVLNISSYYFLARFVGPGIPAEVLGYRADYFAYLLVGIVLSDYLNTSLDAFSAGIRESQLTGTLEALISTRTSLPTILLGTALYPLLRTSLIVVIYLGLGVGLLGVRLSGNWLAAALVLVLALAVFAGFGVLSASFIMVLKRSSPVGWLLWGASSLLGGVIYPVAVLPDWLRAISMLLPITHAIDGMRAALLADARWIDVAPTIVILGLFATVLLPLSFVAFAGATRWARVAGSLGHY